jgi:hypothetical protein
MGAEAYRGARAVRCRDEELTHGARCPHDGCRGKLYDTKQPAIFIRLTGQPLVGATRYEQEVLRCSACQERFTAPLPAGVKPEKYDETCDVSLALAKYERDCLGIGWRGCKRASACRCRNPFNLSAAKRWLMRRCLSSYICDD